MSNRNTKHTPGPWAVEGRYNISTTFGVQYNMSNHSASAEQLTANARLIAASPEMLQALILAEKALNRLHGASMNSGGIVWPTLEAVKQAIAKATGGAE